jgi:hypothetical protein
LIAQFIVFGWMGIKPAEIPEAPAIRLGQYSNIVLGLA